MRALVTGAGGFVGRHLVAHLEACGDAVGRSEESSCDVTDGGAVAELMERERPDVVYHLAALTHVGESWDAPAEVLRVNAEGTLNVLGAAARSGVERVLVVGSAEEYGVVAAQDVPVHEDAPLRPTTPYGASKVAASFLALQADLAGDVETVRVRPFNHTGPGQSERFLLPALARRVAEAERDGTTSIRLGSPDPVRDVSDVRDVVRAYRLLMERGEHGEVYNVCRGIGYTVGEIAQAFVDSAKVNLAIEVDPDLVRAVDTPRLIGDRSRLTAATGWEPEIALEQTVTELLDEARRRSGSDKFGA